MSKKNQEIRNYVAKHLNSVHKPKIELDRKAEMKKNGYTEQDSLLTTDYFGEEE